MTASPQGRRPLTSQSVWNVELPVRHFFRNFVHRVAFSEKHSIVVAAAAAVWVKAKPLNQSINQPINNQSRIDYSGTKPTTVSGTLYTVNPFNAMLFQIAPV